MNKENNKQGATSSFSSLASCTWSSFHSLVSVLICLVMVSLSIALLFCIFVGSITAKMWLAMWPLILLTFIVGVADTRRSFAHGPKMLSLSIHAILLLSSGNLGYILAYSYKNWLYDSYISASGGIILGFGFAPYLFAEIAVLCFSSLIISALILRKWLLKVNKKNDSQRQRAFVLHARFLILIMSLFAAAGFCTEIVFPR